MFSGLVSRRLIGVSIPVHAVLSISDEFI